jgi:RNA polymerase sigma-70 factor (ECF subfamily)
MLVASPLLQTAEPSRTDELGAEAIEACRRGERDALLRFVRCYERRVFAYLSRTLGGRYSVEDLAQEVFLRAYSALARFDSQGTAKLSTWLLTIAHRVAVDARRRDRGTSEVLEPERHRSALPSPEERLRLVQLEQSVARAVAELAPEQREVFVLATFHDLSTAEIAAVVGAFEATVKTRLFRAKAKLRLALGPQFEVTP